MNRIDDYIDNIYNNFDNGDEDAKILKEEMKAHLYEEVEELKNQGLSEEESIEKALGAFGQENSVVNEMNDVLRSRSIFTKMLIKAGIVVFVIGGLFQIMSIFYKVGNEQDLNNTSQYVINQIFYQLKNEDSVSEFKKLEIDRELDKFNKNNSNGLYYIKIEKDNSLKYEYKKDVPKDIIANGNEGTVKENNWSIDYKKTDMQQTQDLDKFNKNQSLSKDLTKSGLKDISYLLFIIALAILDIAFYYYYFTKNQGTVLIAFLLCDFVICVPFFFAWTVFPNHMKETMAFILGTTFIITLILRIFFIKGKKVKV